MTEPALLFVEPAIVDALERELRSHGRHSLSSDAARFVPPVAWSRAIGDPLREFLGRPGKEFRGELSRIFFHLASDGANPPSNLPLVVEALHAGSLVVDDIQDDSEERRGGPALHRAHGVPLALNAGNWLYFWALDLLAEIEIPERRIRAAQRLVTRSLLDCHYGQALDLSARIGGLQQGEVAAIVQTTTELKTGSLVALSAALGTLVGGGSDRQVHAAYRFGRELGSALQMLDDLGGIVSTRRLAKGDEDLRNARPTWPWAWLATTQSASDFERLRSMALAVVDGADSSLLVAEMRTRLLDRRRFVHEHLEGAFARLGSAWPQTAGMRALRSELERLEASYD